MLDGIAVPVIQFLLFFAEDVERCLFEPLNKTNAKAVREENRGAAMGPSSDGLQFSGL